MYILEGNIGVGKSTFLSLVAQQCSEIKTVSRAGGKLGQSGPWQIAP